MAIAHFANKIWNAARFMFMNVDGLSRDCGLGQPRAAVPTQVLPDFRPATLEDRWILSRFNSVTKNVNDSWQPIVSTRPRIASTIFSGESSATGILN